MSARLLRGRAGGLGLHGPTRKGNVVVLTGCLMVALMIVVAFAVDIGYLALVRTEAQRAADAAALAAAWRMVDEGRLRGLVEQVHNAARREAVGYAAMSTVAGRHVALDLNTANDPDGDVLLGRVNNPSVRDPQLSFGSPTAFNAALVRVRLTEGHSGLVPVFFGRVAGVLGAGVAAEAMAAFDDRIEGFRVSSRTANAGLLPFAVREDD
ncbi:MAG: pilus assembly protein TadG-related protein [Thermoguttaceae bacterium]